MHVRLERDTSSLWNEIMRYNLIGSFYTCAEYGSLIGRLQGIPYTEI